MDKQEMLWDVEAALDELDFWRPVYIAMRKRGIPRNECVEAIRYMRCLWDGMQKGLKPKPLNMKSR